MTKHSKITSFSSGSLQSGEYISSTCLSSGGVGGGEGEGEGEGGCGGPFLRLITILNVKAITAIIIIIIIITDRETEIAKIMFGALVASIVGVEREIRPDVVEV